jgi:hypothetical protein
VRSTPLKVRDVLNAKSKALALGAEPADIDGVKLSI